MDSLFKSALKAYGVIDHDSQKEEITIKLDKAKVGILNVKKKVLNMVKEKESERLKVEGDKIIIKL